MQIHQIPRNKFNQTTQMTIKENFILSFKCRQLRKLLSFCWQYGNRAEPSISYMQGIIK